MTYRIHETVFRRARTHDALLSAEPAPKNPKLHGSMVWIGDLKLAAARAIGAIKDAASSAIRDINAAFGGEIGQRTTAASASREMAAGRAPEYDERPETEFGIGAQDDE